MVKGSIVALITPFKEDSSVNYEKLEELIEWHIDKKTDGILVLGTTGEPPTLTEKEKEDIVKFAVSKVNKRVPVIAGSGSNSTAHALETSIKFEKLGVDGLLVVTPYYNKANEQGFIKHFEGIANSVNIPIIMYNVPSRTGCSLPVCVVRHLSKHPNIVALKEASGNISYLVKVSKYISDNFTILSGNDDIVVPLMSMGATGVISVVANVIPEEFHNLVHSYLNGNIEKSRKMQQDYLELINNLFEETNPIPVKEVMNQLGWNVGGYRLPLCEPSVGVQHKIKECLKKYDINNL